jgi:hypothetical protein
LRDVDDRVQWRSELVRHGRHEVVFDARCALSA